MRTVAVFLVCVIPLCAQPSALNMPITIRGTVLEGGINSPIANANITLDRPDLATRAGRGQEETTSAADGSFQFKILTTGAFTIRASLKGYSGIAEVPGSSSDVQHIFIDPQTKSPPAVRVTLARAATVTGNVVDFETNTPLSGVAVELWETTYLAGRLLRTSLGGRAQTDENGQFEISSLSVGRFILSALPGTEFSRHISTELAQNEGLVEQGYGALYWPGTGEIESALRYQLASGSRVNAGTLALRQVPYYRARVSVHGVDCDRDAPLTVRFLPRLQDPSPRLSQLKQISCGQDFDLRALRPGRYQVEILSRPDAIESRKSAKRIFEITDRNQTLDALLTTGTNISGTISAPQGFRDFANLNVTISAVDSAALDARGLITVDTKGAFQIPNVPFGEINLRIQGIPQGFYVRQVQYNNREIASKSTFPFVWDGGGSLTVEIDDQPATIDGTIRGFDGNPATAALILLARWPLNQNDPELSMVGASANDIGAFRITGLQDVEYHVFAFAADALTMLDAPGRLERFLSGAKSISLKRGETLTLDLMLTDLSR